MMHLTAVASCTAMGLDVVEQQYDAVPRGEPILMSVGLSNATQC